MRASRRWVRASPRLLCVQLSQTPRLGRAAGTISDARWASFERTQAELASASALLKGTVLSPEVRTRRAPGLARARA
jgi:hypothetical protein